MERVLRLSITELITKSIINVNKPSGPTSREIVQEIKNIFKVKRCGHTGTLDPRVSGVLVVALENATKTMPVLMGLDKEYEGVIYLHSFYLKCLNGERLYCCPLASLPFPICRKGLLDNLNKLSDFCNFLAASSIIVLFT